jgi:hypothetical protein
VRGVGNLIRSNETSTEVNVPSRFTSFDSNGYTIGSDSIENNASGKSFVAWCWDAGSSTVSNTDGTITSQVRANQTAGFSIVTYTGSSTNTTVGHGLNAAPEMIIVKDRDFPYNWQVNHVGIGADESLLLNTTAAKADFNAWNNTRPTSSVFSLGAGTLGVNTNGNDLIAYCFAPVAGYSAFGSYEGNSSADGPFVYTGFRPALVICKAYVAASTTVTGWVMQDSARGSYNVINAKQLYANENYAEGKRGDGSSTNPQRVDMDFLSNGFKLREIGNEINATGYSYIYMAWAENPFQTNGGLAR